MKKTLITVSLVLSICFMAGLSSGGELKLEQPSQQQLTLVKAALDEGLKVGDSAAVKSSKHGRAYYVGVNFYAQGIQGKMTGVWLVGGAKNKPGLLYSVDGHAHQFSGMRKASETKAAAYMWDEEYTLISNYLKNRK